MHIQFQLAQQCIQISTRINSSSVHTYIFVCFTLRVILQGFVDPIMQQILQPTTSQNPQPLDQQDHNTSQVKQETPHPLLTLQQQEENNDTPTIPSSISPGLLSSEDSDSDSDCIIEKIEKGSPPPKIMKRTAPPPEVSSPHVILKKIPHKQGNGSYTVTTTQDMNGQTTGQSTTQNNTGLEHNHTPKRLRLQDQTPQPSTSTSTTTPQIHKDRKHKKNKKDKKKDKDKDH